MKVTIKTTNITLSDSLSDYIEKKIGFLEKFVGDFLAKGKDAENPIEQRKGRVEVLVNVGRESAGVKKGLYFSKAQVVIPGEKNVIAETTSGDLLKAIDELKDDLCGQLTAIKKKDVSVTERKTRKLKKDISLDEGARFYRKGRIREEGF